MKKRKRTSMVRFVLLVDVPSPHLFLCWWPPRQRSNCSIETSCILPSCEMETLLFWTLWLCSIPPLPCPHLLIQPMPQSGSQPHPTFSHSHVGLRYWVGTISDVTPLFKPSPSIHFIPHSSWINYSHNHITHTQISLQNFPFLHMLYTTTIPVDNFI
jgi:hypothetical protein